MLLRGAVTSYEYSPPMQYEVFCHNCNARYLEQDPDVIFVYGDEVWECADEAACAEQRAAQERTV